MALRTPNLPKSLQKTQLIDLISKAENLGTQRTVRSLMKTYSINPTSMPSIREHIVLPQRGVNPKQRLRFLLLYTYIGSKVEEMEPAIHNLHIIAYHVYYSMDSISDFSRWITREKYRVAYVPIDQLIQSMTNWVVNNEFLEDYERLVECVRINKDRKITALYSLYSCLIGKRLTTQGGQEWGKRCLKAMLGSIGGGTEGEIIEGIFPTFIFAIDFYSTISTSVELRSMAYYYLRSIYNSQESQDWAKAVVGAVLTRLSYTELTGFRLIFTILIKDKKYMWLWGWLSSCCAEVTEALNRFLEYGTEGPYLKILTPSNENPIFNTTGVKKVAEVARLVGVIEGIKSLENVNTGYKFENEQAAKVALAAIMRGGEESLFSWTNYASQYILPKETNPNFYNIIANTHLTGEAEQSQEEPSTTA